MCTDYWGSGIEEQHEIDVLSCQLKTRSRDYTEGTLVTTPRTSVFLTIYGQRIHRVEPADIVGLLLSPNNDDCVDSVNLDVHRCDHLQELVMDDCQAIHKVNCRRCYRLQRLSVSCSSIFELDCRSTDVATLQLTNCLRLSNVRARHSSLVDLHVDRCPALVRLDVGDTRLTQLTLTNCPSLRSVDCTDCDRLTQLTLTNCPNAVVIRPN